MKREDVLFAIVLYAIAIPVIFYFGYRNMNLSIANPQFTPAEVLGVKGIAGADYIVFKYKVNGKVYQGRESNNEIRAIKGRKYLLIYNKKRLHQGYSNLLINIEVEEALGSDLNNKFSVDELKKEGYIGTFK